MKSVLFQPTTPFPGMTPCGPCRAEKQFDIHKNGYIYSFVMRDKIVPEDPYLVLVKAYAFSVRYGSRYPGAEPPRRVRDYLIKSSVVVL